MLENGVLVADGQYQDLVQDSVAFRRLAGFEQGNKSVPTHTPLSSTNALN